MKAQTKKFKTRQTREQYEIGEEYYKRDTDKQWKGPADVLGLDGAVAVCDMEVDLLKLMHVVYNQ